MPGRSSDPFIEQARRLSYSSALILTKKLVK
jgi:hypothetical protein